MKIIVSISLLLLLVFNWFGYLFVFNWVQKKMDTQLEARLDRNEYQEDELFEISVALNLPYQNDWSNFERVDGEIEIAGTHYKYVKRKIENGRMILKCIPNHTKEQLLTAKDSYTEMVNDLDKDQPVNNSSTSKIVKLNITDFEEISSLQLHLSALDNLPLPINGFLNSSLSTAYKFTPEQPPEISVL